MTGSARAVLALAGVGVALACGSPPAGGPVAEPVPAGPPDRIHGVCDASAAVSWSGLRVVADDETNALRFYRPADVHPVHTVDLAGLVPGLADDEADFEGMALDGDRLWLIGSHDAGKKKAAKAPRGVLLALDLRAGEPPAVEVHLDARDLRARLAADPRWSSLIERAEGRTSKDVDGFSIEGLATDPRGRFTGGEPGLLVGLRAPVVDGQATLLPLVPGDGLRIGDPVRLDLGGMGVRSLEWAGDGWVGVAGAPTAGGSFRVFRWSGEGAPTFAEAPAGLAPEALFAEGEAWWVLSDDGNEEVLGKPCKKAREVDRRARVARLP